MAGSRLMRQPFTCVTFGYAGFLRQFLRCHRPLFERLIEPSRSPIRTIGTLNAPPRSPSIFADQLIEFVFVDHLCPPHELANNVNAER